jgi:hypothetical protein
MKLTHRIADLLTGGEFSARQTALDAWGEIYRACREDRAAALDAEDKTRQQLHAAKACLDRIAEMETPGANATVKRMARVARGEE